MFSVRANRCNKLIKKAQVKFKSPSKKLHWKVMDEKCRDMTILEDRQNNVHTANIDLGARSQF